MSERNIKGLNFDINDEKELSDYIELTFNSLLGDKVKNVNNVLYKIGINISSNDISKAEINKWKRPRENKNEIIFLNKRFIDNVVLTSISTKGRGKNDIGYYNIIIRNHFNQIYNNKKMRIMCVSESKQNDCLTKYNIKKYQNLTNAKLKNENDKFKSIEFIMKLNDIDQNKAIQILSGAELQGLNNQGVYINDIDFTIDIGLTFDTKKMIDELIDKFDFHYDGELHLRIIEEDYDNNVSFWFVDDETDIKIRVKLYNKFIQSLESPAVRKQCGSHLLNWINNENKMLDEAIEKSLNFGFTRIELTFYTDTIPADEIVNKNFEFVYNIIRQMSDEAIFYNTINNQFYEIMNEVNENLFVYDKTKKQLLQIRWYNSKSDKMNGILYKNIGYSSNRMIEIVSKYSFNNLPIKIVMIEYDKNNVNNSTDEEDDEKELIIVDEEDDDKANKKEVIDKDQKVKINVRTYLKNGFNETYLSDTNENYKISTLQNQPEQRGIKYKDMNFKIQTEKHIKVKDDLKDVFFTMIITDKKIEYLQIKKIKTRKTNSKDKKRINQVELLNEQVERFKINNEIKNEEFKKYQLKRLNNINKLNEIDNNYKITITNKKSLKDFKIGDDFFITTFMRRGENQIIFYDYIRNEWLFGNKQILDFINDIFVKYYKYIHYKDFDDRKLYYLLNENDDIDFLGTAKVVKKSVNKNKDKIVELSITNNLTKEDYIKKDDDDKNNDINNNDDDDVIYEINEEINRINTIPFEKLDLMENYEIIGIKKQPYRKMYHYYLHLKYQKKIMKYNEDDKKVFVVNQWMRSILEQLDINKLIGAKPLKFKVLQTKKTTTAKISENLIEVDKDIINQYKP